MRLKEKIKEYVHTVKLLFLIPRRYADYLIDGEYRWNVSATVLFSDKEADVVNDELSAIFLNISTTKNVLRELFCKWVRFRIKKNPKVFWGQFLSISSSAKELRIFDLRSRKLLTVFEDTKRASKLLKQRDYWNMYIPTVKYSIYNASTIIEPLLKKISFSSLEVFPTILSIYTNYYEAINNGDLEFCHIDVEDEMNMCKLPILMTHGDLWKSNVIYDGEKVYIIDFEHSKNRVFYYDLFTYMLMDFAFFNDLSIWQNYLSGVYDQAFSRAFSALGVVYYPCYKIKYYKVFLDSFKSDRPVMASGERFIKVSEIMLNAQ